MGWGGEVVAVGVGVALCGEVGFSLQKLFFVNLTQKVVFLSFSGLYMHTGRFSQQERRWRRSVDQNRIFPRTQKAWTDFRKVQYMKVQTK